MAKIALFFFTFLTLFSDPIPAKVLICGIGRNIKKAVPNTIKSAESLGKQFADYRVIIYENNSKDETKKLLSDWAKKNPKVIFLSENIPSLDNLSRTVRLARARNIVLEKALAPKYDDYEYIVWADLDFRKPWDIKELVHIVLHPDQEWDAVFGYGAYDLFAFRSPEAPIGFELIGNAYWEQLDEIRKHFDLKPTDPWKKVYSAFGGIAIYKREALRGCRYSGTVTEEMKRVLSPAIPGVKEWNHTTCEHIPLHASMIVRGYDRLFVDPRLHSDHPPR
jgi:glycosyltransferase involved in cell wall biosynthesis